jgi:hypothetical protein
MNQQNRFVDAESPNVKNAMREVQVRRVIGKTFIFLKENVLNGLILQSAQVSEGKMPMIFYSKEFFLGGSLSRPSYLNYFFYL